MRLIDAAEVNAHLKYPDLVDVLAEAFRADLIAPSRHHHAVCLDDRPEATLLLMPAWSGTRKSTSVTHAAGGGYIGVKIVTVMPDNGTRDLPAVQGAYLLLSGETGRPLALIDAPTLTNWRTAAASALASRYLSRPDSAHLLMVGAGSLAPYLIRAHASVRPIKTVTIWNRTSERARRLAAQLSRESFKVLICDDLQQGVQGADIISCATLSTDPLIRGGWLLPGVHLDLVGAFTPAMREADDEAMHRVRLFVDTRAGAPGEAGDIVQSIRGGAITADDIIADLHELTRGKVDVRRATSDITAFKSVGASLEDLATAIYLYEVEPS